jgi:hypothetical protein
MLGQFSSSLARFGNVKSGLFMLGQYSSFYGWLGPVRSG